MTAHSLATHLECVYCRTRFPLGDYFEGCPACATDGWRANLSVQYDYGRAGSIFHELLQGSARGVWGYAPLLPVAPGEPAPTLGEGNTPLVALPRIAATLGVAHVWAKDESQNPTWSHKDRLAAVGMARARQLSPRAVTVASTGNHGGATAAYAARVGLPAVVFTSVGIPRSMEAFVRAYGAAVVRVATKERRWDLMAEAVRRFGWFPLGTFAPHRVSHPYGPEGYKTISYEIWRDLGRVPDWVAVPVATGDALYGIWKGFWELEEMGLTDTTPKMLAAEVSGPLEHALRRGLQKVEPVPGRSSIAFSIGGAFAGQHALVALRQSSGAAAPVNDAAILDAQTDLAREGLFAEPSAAAAVAALVRLAAADGLAGATHIVCVVTSGGLKDPGTYPRDLDSLPIFTGSIGALAGYVREHYQLSL